MTDISERLHADIRRLAPGITARSAEIEAERRLPPDLVELLRSIGAFRMFVPHSHGGLELDLPTALEIIVTLASIDGSVGWNVATCNAGHLVASSLARETYEQLYHDGADMITAGSNQSEGTAEAIDGDWRVAGRWPFVSGCQNAAWIFALCVMTEDGKPLAAAAGEAGPPLVRGFFLPARDWQIEDTWYVAGLKGTGSQHVALRNKLVPAANFFDFPSAVHCLPGPLYQSARHILPLMHGAVCVGMAEGALNEIIELANSGRRQLHAPAPMRDSEIFQSEIGRVAADIRAARAFLQLQATSHWRHALARTLKGEALSTQGTQSTVWIATTCVRAVDACFALGGGAAVYETSPLPRRLRDLHTAAQHAAAHQRHYVRAGKLLLDSTASSNAVVA
jgi:alkylation response protein AidB-like acyl-CoA dehydrogenase